MGACFEWFEVDAKKSTQAAFDEQVIEDKERNGHQDGYSGDFQTVDGLKEMPNEFKTHDEALDFLENTCQKWEDALSVTYLTPKGKKITIVGAWCAC